MSRGHIGIRILGPEGAPCVGGRAWWRDEEHRFTSAEANEDGYVRIESFSTIHEQPLWVEAEGLARVRLEPVRARVGVETDLGDLRLARGPRVRARVIGPDGAPVSQGLALIRQRYHVLAHTVSDDGPAQGVDVSEGRFEGPPLPPGEATIVLQVEGAATISRSVSVDAHYEGDIDLGTLMLPAEQRLEGRVVDPRGEPVAQAFIRVLTGAEIQARTEDDGGFVIRGLGAPPFDERLGPLAEYLPQGETLSISARGFVRHHLQRNPAKSFLDVTLQPSKVLEGQAVDEASGAPVPIEELSLCQVIRQGDLPPIDAG